MSGSGPGDRVTATSNLKRHDNRRVFFLYANLRSNIYPIIKALADRGAKGSLDVSLQARLFTDRRFMPWKGGGFVVVAADKGERFLHR